MAAYLDTLIVNNCKQQGMHRYVMTHLQTSVCYGRGRRPVVVIWAEDIAICVSEARCLGFRYMIS